MFRQNMLLLECFQSQKILAGSRSEMCSYNECSIDDQELNHSNFWIVVRFNFFRHLCRDQASFNFSSCLARVEVKRGMPQ